MTVLEDAAALRREGRHEQAREVLIAATSSQPHDARLQYAAACVHDALGREAEAIPFYRRALAGELPPDERRSAFTGLGSTYRTLGRYDDARDTLRAGLIEFPDAHEMTVFLAMTLHNLGEHKRAIESLLKLVVATTADPEIKAYGPAIEFYAQDVDRTWGGPG